MHNQYKLLYFSFFVFNHWPGVNFTFKFGINERFGGGRIIEGCSIIISSIGYMIDIYQWIWRFFGVCGSRIIISSIEGIISIIFSSNFVIVVGGISDVFKMGFRVLWEFSKYWLRFLSEYWNFLSLLIQHHFQ